MIVKWVAMLFLLIMQLSGHVHVGDWAIFAGFTGAHQFTRIGAHSFIGMNTLTTKDIPAYVMAEGQPIKPRGVNTEGLKRRVIVLNKLLILRTHIVFFIVRT